MLCSLLMRALPNAPDLEAVLKKSQFKLAEIAALAAGEANRQDRYLYWDKLRYRPCPKPLTPEEWWLGLKVHRMGSRHFLPITDARGNHFSYTLNSLIQSHLYELDSHKNGLSPTRRNGAVSEETKFRYLVTSGMEEAIMSSKLEGASTTRSMAKQMILRNQEPANHDDRMILNNYRTMEKLRQLTDKPLTPDTVLLMHRLMTEGTLDKPEQCGSFRTDEDEVVVAETVTGEEVHIPPKAQLLPERMRQLCNFANDSESAFVHPILKAVILHFWLAFDHPFVDGNGRTARALFYWMMLRSGYDIFRYITISREIYRHPKSYYQSFRYTETDDADLTYFIADQLQTIRQSVNDLYAYIERKLDEQDTVMGELRANTRMNIRQQQLLLRLMAHPDDFVSAELMMTEYRISKPTALADLNALTKLGLLTRYKHGRSYAFYAAEKLDERMLKLRERT